MTNEQRRFVRLYYDDLGKDYAAVWFDPTCLSTYARLLALCDHAWPSRAQLPAAARRADLEILTRTGLVTLLPNGLFSMKGYDEERAEREAKSAKARQSVSLRKDRVPTTEPTNVDTNVPTNVSTAGARPTGVGTGSTSSSEGVQGEPSLPSLNDQAIAFLEGMTGRSVRIAGDRQLSEYDRQIADHGFDVVIAAYQKSAKLLPPRPTARQLVWSAMRILEPFADPKKAEAAERSDDEERAHQRRLEATRAKIAPFQRPS